MAEPPISPIRPDQIPTAARVMANAFADAPRYTFLLPNDAQRQAKLPAATSFAGPALLTNDVVNSLVAAEGV